ncbi:MAG TPA: Sec-independent protein translocase protein TatB [Allosphingosinicella sp.]|nr:Sec-independent protein translocase protein TatB [Allosphingosinicella sp.]
MFGIGYSELLVIAIIGLVVIGPKDLPRVMREIGRWIGKAQGMARHFRAGIDNMIREAELEEMEKKWREENERIMRDHPLLDPGAEMLPLTGPAASAPAGSAEASAPPATDAPSAEPAHDPDAPELPLGPPTDIAGRTLP